MINMGSAQNRTRTCTTLLSLVPETSASTIPPPGHSRSSVQKRERQTGLGPATSTLARLRSTNWAIAAFFCFSAGIPLKCDAKIQHFLKPARTITKKSCEMWTIFSIMLCLQCSQSSFLVKTRKRTANRSRRNKHNLTAEFPKSYIIIFRHTR